MTDVPEPLKDIVAWSEIARNVGLVLAGGIGLGLAAWRSRAANLQAKAALEQSELARRDHITEIFNRAVGQLGEDRLEVRLGAVYTLRSICHDDRFQMYAGPIRETLTAYLRFRTGDGDDTSDPVVDAIVDILRD